jgi:hypothetical protein
MQILILLVIMLRRFGFDLHSEKAINRIRFFSFALGLGWLFLLGEALSGSSLVGTDPFFYSFRTLLTLVLSLSLVLIFSSPRKGVTS